MWGKLEKRALKIAQKGVEKISKRNWEKWTAALREKIVNKAIIFWECYFKKWGIKTKKLNSWK